MNNEQNIFTLMEQYRQKYDINQSVESLFIEFQYIVKIHQEFEKYLKKKNLNEKLEKMKRNERLKEKRKLFTKWYFNKQTNTSSKQGQIELSEILFVSERTIRDELVK